MSATNQFGYEIDFIPVGTGEKSGDAIAIRYGMPGAYKVMVVDGGTKESGQMLVDHIRGFYNTDHVDYVVNTHPDNDHASGLTVIMEQLTVGELWLHRPWEHSADLRNLFKDGRITDNSLTNKLKDSLNAAHKLEEIAISKDIPIYEPFQGEMIGEFVVMSPSEDTYNELVPLFRKTPEAKPTTEASLIQKLSEAAHSVLDKVAEWIEENWDTETLSENGETGPENESSVVLYAKLNGKGILFTGDAGKDALTTTIDYAESRGIDLPSSISFVQVPHHGSRRNVTPSVLDRLLGIKTSEEISPTKTAYVSASVGSSTHPKKVVTNAFKRRGARVFPNESTIQHNHNMPSRDGWSTIAPLPFYSEVER